MLICCFLERKRFSADISAKLGSSFSLVPFVIVVVSALLTFYIYFSNLSFYYSFCLLVPFGTPFLFFIFVDSNE